MKAWPLLLALLLLLPRTPRKRKRAVVSAEDKAVVLDEFERRGWPRAEADSVIARESGWDTRSLNPKTQAAGLIQMMPRNPNVLALVGWNSGPQAFAMLTAPEQAPYIGRYLDRVSRKWRVPGDTYLAIFAPSFVGAPDDEVIFPEYSKAWIQNPGLRDGPTGPITAGSVRRKVTSAP